MTAQTGGAGARPARDRFPARRAQPPRSVDRVLSSPTLGPVSAMIARLAPRVFPDLGGASCHEQGNAGETSRQRDDVFPLVRAARVTSLDGRTGRAARSGHPAICACRV